MPLVRVMVMIKQINVRNGIVIRNRFIGDQYDIEYNDFPIDEELFEMKSGDYSIIVKQRAGGVFNVVIVKGENWFKPVVQQEVGDYESLVFTLQNYIDLLASFNEVKINKN